MDVDQSAGDDARGSKKETRRPDSLAAKNVDAAEVGKAGVALIHDQIRQAILGGRLAPGEELLQTQLAERLGISRTPLREALRMLQEEGLVEAERNRRMRVAELSIKDLESIYAHRIHLEALGVALTVPQLTSEDLEALSDAVNAMDEAAGKKDLDEWARTNVRFHDLLVVYAKGDLRKNIKRYAEASERYRRLRIEHGFDARRVAQKEHRTILKACQNGSQKTAAIQLARHLAHTALGLIAQKKPEHNSVVIRTALKLLLGNATGEDVRF